MRSGYIRLFLNGSAGKKPGKPVLEGRHAAVSQESRRNKGEEDNKDIPVLAERYAEIHDCRSRCRHCAAQLGIYVMEYRKDFRDKHDDNKQHDNQEDCRV